MNKIYLMGDLHGSYTPIFNLNKRNHLDSSDVIILLGDVGANFWLDKRDNFFKQKLSSFNCTFFCLRGNHESRISDIVDDSKKKIFWEVDFFWRNAIYREKKYPNIVYALDNPVVYQINNYKVLTIPGAYSVDKIYRLYNKLPWFKNEQLTKEELAEAKMYLKTGNIDLILSHTCPIYYEPTDLFISSIDQNLVDKTMERELGRFSYVYPYKVWCWGHFHQYRDYPRDLTIPNVKNPRHIMLYNDYAVELENLMNDKEVIKI